MLRNILLNFILSTMLLTGTVYAVEIATPTLNVAWDWEGDESKLKGFNFYGDGVLVCHTSTPIDREMTCTFSMENKPYVFTMTAQGHYKESGHSEPFNYTPPTDIFENINPPTGVDVTTVEITITVNVNTN